MYRGLDELELVVGSDLQGRVRMRRLQAASSRATGSWDGRHVYKRTSQEVVVITRDCREDEDVRGREEGEKGKM